MRSGNLSGVADIVIPAKIGLTERFFADPELPADLKRLKRRAMSNAYLRALDYLQIRRPSHWLVGMRLTLPAIITNPFNTKQAIGRATKQVRWHIGHKLGVIRRKLVALLLLPLRPLRRPVRLTRRLARFALQRAVGLTILAMAVGVVAVSIAAGIDAGSLDALATRLLEAAAVFALFGIWLQLRWRS